MAESTALARLEESARQIIKTPQQLAERVREWEKVAFVLTPAISVASIAAQYVISPAVVVLDPAVDESGNGSDCYRDGSFMKKDERGLSRIGLRKISAAVGISWDPAQCRRTDDGRTPLYWTYYVWGTYTAFDGKETPVDGIGEIDLRDGSDQIGNWTPDAWRALVAKNRTLPKDQQEWSINGWSEKRVRQARRFGLRLAETSAKNRAIRDLGLKQKYSVQELMAKPFIALRMTWQPDMSDPEQRRAVTAKGLGSRNLLYPQHHNGPTSDPDTIDAEPVRETSEGDHVNTVTGEVVSETAATRQQSNQAPNTTASTTAASAQTQPPASSRPQPAEPSGPRITAVRTKEGISSKTKQPYTKFFVTLDDGRELATFDVPTGELATKLMQAKAPIEVTTTERRWGKDNENISIDIVELQRAQPRLPMDERADYDDEPDDNPKL